ncbi:hypothetical protein RUM43_012479 [Polyplax serrata]|uniref:Uncharacterized protein n=1 Tax=Polyplax serrata TaxID=468196 RepID=A0AAN8S7H5_POLSC
MTKHNNQIKILRQQYRNLSSSAPVLLFLRQTGRKQDDPDVLVQCKTITSETYKIELNDPCYSAYTLDECSPLYISLVPPEQSLGTACPNCRLPGNVQYEISAVGLTCYNSAVHLLSSPMFLCVSLLFLFIWNSRLY